MHIKVINKACRTCWITNAICYFKLILSYLCLDLLLSLPNSFYNQNFILTVTSVTAVIGHGTPPCILILYINHAAIRSTKKYANITLQVAAMCTRLFFSIQSVIQIRVILWVINSLHFSCCFSQKLFRAGKPWICSYISRRSCSKLAAVTFQCYYFKVTN